MDRTSHIAFDELLHALKKEGFVLNLHDYIEFAALFTRFSGSREDFKYYLAPVICRNKEEQGKFYAVYDQFYSGTGEREKPAQRRPRSNIPANKMAGKPITFRSLVRNFYFWYFLIIFIAGLIRFVPGLWRKHISIATITLPPDTKFGDENTSDPSGGFRRRVFVVKPFAPTAIDKNDLTSQIIPTGKRIEEENSVHSTAFAWLLVLGITSLALSASFFPQKRSKFLPEVDLDNLKGDTTPFDLPFLSKDQHIQKLPALTQASGNLIRPIPTGMHRLDIKKTIHEAVRSYGILSPVYADVERRPEYLILIDRKKALFCNLFRYLARTFMDDTVNINYYFYDDDYTFYAEDKTRPVGFYELYERHSHARLILMSDGADLIDYRNERLAVKPVAGFSQWDDKLMMTPVPEPDWGDNEFMLTDSFRLVSADIENCIGLAEWLYHDETEDSFLTMEQPHGHAGRHLSEDIDSLYEYLADEDLFQWVCALAIYPSLRWEILLALGTAILNDRKAIHKLNFTNLLKIARIEWLSGKTIPPAVRICLLKKLGLQEEIIARRTILSLLKESDGIITEKNFSYKEKIIQQLTQSFVLFANDPKKNQQYEDDAKKFMTLWEKKQVADLATVLYLKNTGRQWETPIRSMDDQSRSVGANKFLNELLALRIISDPRIRAFFRNAGLTFFMILMLLFLFKDILQRSGLNQIIPLVNRDYPNNEIMITLPVNNCLKNMVNANQMTISLNNFDNNRYTQTLSIVDKDSLTIRFGDITMAGKDSAKETFQLILNNDLTIDCPFKEYYSQYKLVLQGEDCNTPLRPIIPDYELKPLPHSLRQ